MDECRDCAYSDRPIYKWPCDVCRATKNGRSMYCPEEADHIANDEGKTDYISRWGAQDAMTSENLIRNLDSVENGDAKRYARSAIRVLERLKPADVRPVVYCRDCRFWGGRNGKNECSLITSLADPRIWLKTQPDDFCSSGERRKGGANG